MRTLRTSRVIAAVQALGVVAVVATAAFVSAEEGMAPPATATVAFAQAAAANAVDLITPETKESGPKTSPSN